LRPTGEGSLSFCLEGKMKRRIGAAILGGTIAIAGFAGTAAASSNAVSTFTFYDCYSTDGSYVPSSFVAVKTALPGAAPHAVSAASAFVVLGSTDTYTVYDFGFGAPHGITDSGVATDWCTVNFFGIGPTLVGGHYNP
jgi:hypothetical protein